VAFSFVLGDVGYDAPMLRAVLLSLSLAFSFGCESYARFRADGTAVFRGTVYGDGEASFLRRGFPAGSVAEILFDPDAAQRASAGSITVTTPEDVAVLDAVTLETIQPLAHDMLSEYSFPGAGRIQNFLFLARPTEGPLMGREVMVFLSLMESGEMELRVIAGTGDEAHGDVFGVFRLRRTAT
jgi:hypothetical protein